MAACGPAGEPGSGSGDTTGDSGTSTAPGNAPGVREASFGVVGSSLRIRWSVINPSGGDLVVFDDRRPDEAAGSERYGAFVIAGHDAGTVEVSLGVAPAADCPSSSPDGYRFARHTAGNVSRQSLLCRDPFDLPAP